MENLSIYICAVVVLEYRTRGHWDLATTSLSLLRLSEFCMSKNHKAFWVRAAAISDATVDQLEWGATNNS